MSLLFNWPYGADLHAVLVCLLLFFVCSWAFGGVRDSVFPAKLINRDYILAHTHKRSFVVSRLQINFDCSFYATFLSWLFRGSRGNQILRFSAEKYSSKLKRVEQV